VRYADDCNIYIRSEKAGRRFIEGRLKLQINTEKSAVARPWHRSSRQKVFSLRGTEALVSVCLSSFRACLNRPGIGGDHFS
jgi:RNA-directed DNA polymerase